MNKTVKYQSFGHWFYYHWKYLLAGVVVILLGVYFWHNSREPVDVDYQISWVGATALSQSEEESIITAVAEAGTDQNGDGQVTATVTQYIINFQSDTDYVDSTVEDSYSYTLKLIAQLQTKDCYLFLMDDPEQLQFTTGLLRYLDGSIPGEEDNYQYLRWEEMCVPWNCDGFARTAWLGRRGLFEEDADYEETFPGGEQLFQALIAP